MGLASVDINNPWAAGAARTPIRPRRPQGLEHYVPVSSLSMVEEHHSNQSSTTLPHCASFTLPWAQVETTVRSTPRLLACREHDAPEDSKKSLDAGDAGCLVGTWRGTTEFGVSSHWVFMFGDTPQYRPALNWAPLHCVRRHSIECFL